MTEENTELVAGRYRLVERIGQGGMGRVWRGVDQRLFGREVAVKEILLPPGTEEADRAALLRRFTGEARAAVTISHPGIITVHDVVEHRGAPVIVMEFVRGPSLAAEIRDRGPLPVRRVAEIGAAVLDALAEAHAAQIVHRDIKPDNVLLAKDRVVLTDFGIAHLADATTRLSHSGLVIGTPQYMPPEQLEGRRPTPANDLWALGATLYHAVEGCPPFGAEGLHALAVAVLTRPHRPPLLAGPLGPVLDALLVKDPARRASAREAAGLLAAVLREEAHGATAPPAPAPTPEPAPAPAPAEPPTPPEPSAPTAAAPTPTAVDAAAGPVPPGPGGPSGGPRRRLPGRRSVVVSAALAVLATGGGLTWTLSHGDGGPGRGGPAAADPVKVVIGVSAPLTGDTASFGQGIRNSVDLAVRTANERRLVPGVAFEVRALDDEALPAKGLENASRFADAADVLGVVGPFTSSVARSLVPPLDRAGVVTVSPSNTDPVLTLGPDWAQGTRSRPHRGYFRTTPTDTAQGPFAARHLYRDAGKRKVFAVDDGSAHGTALTAGFRREFTGLGGSVVGAAAVAAGEKDFTALAGQVKASGAEAVYFGGDHTVAAPLSRRLKESGAQIPLMGGDGILDTQFVKGNDRAEGDLATWLGVPAQDTAGGRAFLARYAGAGYREDAGFYGAAAHDAAWAVIEAVKAVAAANGGALPSDARSKMADAVGRVSFEGATGPVAFDAYGDTVNRQLTVYTVRAGAWESVKSGAYEP
ncbi:bifunctional serine/threonine-protein kinase/ABC transporter substrate-binding protein [Streptomyces globosus]|uniref:bifunctional serine/threonine-protein kinase/ABC transporter substrate-binding protein n=2 Tax=Streptomyces globosus TaxID=68209 RepID=UPI0036353132